MSICHTTHPDQTPQTESRNLLPHVVLIGGAITLLVIGILATTGVLNGMGTTPATYLSYAAYGSAALLTLFEVSFLAIKYCKRSSQALLPKTNTKIESKTRSSFEDYRRPLTEEELDLLKEYVSKEGEGFFNQCRDAFSEDSRIDSKRFIRLVTMIIGGFDADVSICGFNKDPSVFYRQLDQLYQDGGLFQVTSTESRSPWGESIYFKGVQLFYLISFLDAALRHLSECKNHPAQDEPTHEDYETILKTRYNRQLDSSESDALMTYADQHGEIFFNQLKNKPVGTDAQTFVTGFKSALKGTDDDLMLPFLGKNPYRYVNDLSALLEQEMGYVIITETGKSIPNHRMNQCRQIELDFLELALTHLHNSSNAVS